MPAIVRKVLLIAVLAGLVAYAVLDPGGTNPPLAGAALSRRAEVKPGSAPTAEDAPARAAQGGWSLPERTPLGEPRAELFATRSWEPPPPKASPNAGPPPKPVAPPVPYRFAGQLVQGGRPEVLLAKGDAVIPVVKGDTLDGVYRIESIGETEITMLYLPLKQVQKIPVAGVLEVPGDSSPAQPGVANASPAGAMTQPVAASQQSPAPAVRAPSATPGRPARVLWDGPLQVRIGAPFSVALRVTSEQPVRASPMQLKFDPSVLETVAVKPGRFFGRSEKNFIYRVNPDGSIF